MGEKIRDIKPVTIGKTSLMVELNEGYYAAQGRLIHVQNEKFRYLFTEPDFYHLCSLVMRAWSEFDYLKHKETVSDEIKGRTEECAEQEKTRESLKEVAKLLNASVCRYAVIDLYDSTVRLLINEEDLHKAEAVLQRGGAQKIDHPVNKKRGYKFLYQMHPFILYQRGDICFELFCQLPCMSITPKTWIPLDRSIQAWTWANVVNRENIYWCDDLSCYIFYLCWAIFADKAFSPQIIDWLSRNNKVLNCESVNKLLETVFFRFTPVLISRLKNKEYNRIISDYYHFMEY